MTVRFWLGDTPLEQSKENQVDLLVRKALESMGRANEQ